MQSDGSITRSFIARKEQKTRRKWKVGNVLKIIALIISDKRTFKRILMFPKRKTASSHFAEIVVLRNSAIGIALIPVGVPEFIALKTSAMMLPSRIHSGVERREVLLKNIALNISGWRSFSISGSFENYLVNNLGVVGGSDSDIRKGKGKSAAR